MKNKEKSDDLNNRIADDNHHDEKFPVLAGKETTLLSIGDKVKALIGKAQVSNTAQDDLYEIRHGKTPDKSRE